MHCIDIFNGDADGICALQQLRLDTPQPTATLISGVKRDIALLDRISTATNRRITVLDISLDLNRHALTQLLAQGNHVFYADHHYSGAIPVSDALHAYIETSPFVCTSLIIDSLLAGAYRSWAIVGAFGDNLDEVALEHADTIELGEDATRILKEIGMLLNYNGYGMTVDDLLIHPADLFREVNRFTDPFSFHRESPLLARLRQGYENDMARAASLLPARTASGSRAFLLPDAAWAKRVVGVFANQLCRDQPKLAHAALIANADGTFQVSVRAPLTTRQGAETLCREFATGGGRAAAAGINRLPRAELEDFLATFAHHFSSTTAKTTLP